MNVVSLTQPAAVDSRKAKNVPKLYETDESKYAGPHRWQIQPWAKLARRLWRQRAYTRWTEQACEQIDVHGLEHLDMVDGPCVFVANHTSHVDTLIVHAAVPERIRKRLYFGAAADRWFVKGKKKLVLKPWYQSLALGNFPIKRGGGADALAYAEWLLEQKQHVFLFPEGTRSTSDELGEFKHGATLLALRMNVPVVPIYLAGVKQIRPKGSAEVVKGVAQVEFLPPIYFSFGSDVASATATIRDRLNRVHRKYVRESELSKAA